jgi:hypothetical protein
MEHETDFGLNTPETPLRAGGVNLLQTQMHTEPGHDGIDDILSAGNSVSDLLVRGVPSFSRNWKLP